MNDPAFDDDDFSTLEASAREGDTLAMYLLGKSLMGSDPARGRALLEASAEGGNADAMNALAYAIRETEPVVAHMWLEKAAHLGHLGAMSNLGLLLINVDPEAAQDWTEAAAVEGDDVEAWFNQGAMLQRLGRTRAAMAWFVRAAAAGDERAAFNLGLLYQDTDPEFAIHSYEQAARRGNVKAMSILGSLLADRNAPQSRLWLEKAADAGDKDAAYNLGVAARRDARLWFEGLARDGDADAMLGLAYLLRGSDPGIARWWVEQAVAANHPDAADSMEQLFGNREVLSESPGEDSAGEGDGRTAETDQAAAEPSSGTVRAKIEGIPTGELWVELQVKADGGYVIAGQHLFPPDQFGPTGRDEYEYWLSIPAEGALALAAALGTDVAGI